MAERNGAFPPTNHAALRHNQSASSQASSSFGHSIDVSPSLKAYGQLFEVWSVQSGPARWEGAVIAKSVISTIESED